VLTNGATLKIGSGGDQWVTNAGTVLLAGGTLDAGAITNTGTILGYGVLAAAVHNSGVVAAMNGTQTLAGVVSGRGRTGRKPARRCRLPAAAASAACSTPAARSGWPAS